MWVIVEEHGPELEPLGEIALGALAAVPVQEA